MRQDPPERQGQEQPPLEVQRVPVRRGWGGAPQQQMRFREAVQEDENSKP